MTRIKTLLDQTPQVPTSTPFLFEMNIDAAERNTNILADFGFDITKAIATFPNSHMSYGSEFRPVSHLKPLLQKSLHWESIEPSLSKGARFPLERISNARRKRDNEEAIKKGNITGSRRANTRRQPRQRWRT